MTSMCIRVKLTGVDVIFINNNACFVSFERVAIDISGLFVSEGGQALDFRAVAITCTITFHTFRTNTFCCI